MAQREILLPWDSQPQETVRPADGWDIIYLFNGATPATDLASQSPNTPINGPVSVAMPDGMGVSLNGSNQAIDTGRKFTGISGSIVLLADAIDSTGTSKTIACQSTDDAGNNIGLGWQNNDFRIGGKALYIGALTGRMMLGGTWGAGGVVAYVDGESVATNSYTGPATAPAGPYNFHLGAFRYSGGRLFHHQATHLWMLVSSRAYSAQEMRDLYLDYKRSFAPQSIWVPVPAGGGGSTVTLDSQSATHAHGADNVALTLSTTLAIDSATHGHSAQNVTLSTTASADLVVQSAIHAHTSSTPAPTTDTALTIASAAHAHSADSLTLSTTGTVSLVAHESNHAHSADSLTLTTNSALTVANANHAHAADNVTLADAPPLAVQDASHTHSATSPTLTLDSTLQAQDATHAHSADAPALTLQTWLEVAHAWHAHLAGNVTLSLPADAAVLGSLVGRPSARGHTRPANLQTSRRPARG